MYVYTHTHIYIYIYIYNDDTYDVVYCHAFIKYTNIHTLTLWARAGHGAQGQ